MLAAKDFSRLLTNIPEGAWVALSKNEEKVLAYAAELQDAIQKAKEVGENDPIVIRVPETDGSTLFFVRPEIANLRSPIFRIPSSRHPRVPKRASCQTSRFVFNAAEWDKPPILLRNS
jgi:hypothetical protein